MKHFANMHACKTVRLARPKSLHGNTEQTMVRDTAFASKFLVDASFFEDYNSLKNLGSQEKFTRYMESSGRI